MTAERPNLGTIEAWNTVLFDKFARYERVLIEGLGLHGARLYECYPPAAGARLLDVGCGFGDSVVRLAKIVGEGGRVVGVDCAENFINASRKRADAAGVEADFLCCDVQFDDLGGPYDAAYARFGTMFFDSPVAALRNIRKSLVPGGTLNMSVWRKRQDNPCFYVAQQVVEQFIDPEDKATDQLTCGPGPFSMAGPDMVSDQLLAAGYVEPQFIRFDAPLCMGSSVDEALAMARDIGPAGETIRLAQAKAEHLANEIETAMREAFEPFVRDDGIWATSSTWLISARVPEATQADR
jgi:SAM-dependent methyltransferase